MRSYPSAHNSWVATCVSGCAGISMSSSQARRWPTSTMAQSSGPTSSRAISSTGFLVAGGPLQREGGVAAALSPGDGVDLVHDDRLRRLEEAAAPLGGEEDVQRLWGGDQDVRRVAQHLISLARRRVPGAHGDADVAQ